MWVVISKRLDLRRRRLKLFRRRKYFWAWLATWVGVRVFTKFLEIPLQSPFPTFCNPNKNSLCSSSVHGIPKPNNQSKSNTILFFFCTKLNNNNNYLSSGRRNGPTGERRRRKHIRHRRGWSLELEDALRIVTDYSY